MLCKHVTFILFKSSKNEHLTHLLLTISTTLRQRKRLKTLDGMLKSEGFLLQVTVRSLTKKYCKCIASK